MAVLEKIRSKSVLLFSVIIVALLAFILGDFINSGSSLLGPGDTVAKANGAKVNLADYNNLKQQFSEQAKTANGDIFDQQIIEMLLTQALLEQEYDRLGLNVTDATLSEVMLGDRTSSYVLSMFSQKAGFDMQALMSQFPTSRSLFDAVNNPAKYKLDADMAAMFKRAWAETEKEVEKTIKGQNYAYILGGLFTASNIDAKAVYDERNTSVAYSYVSKEFTSVPDDKVKLTDEDYKAFYDQHKGAFELQQESRYVHYIAVPIIPSQSDYAAIDAEMKEVVAVMDTTPDPSLAVRAHKNFQYNKFSTTKKGLAQQQNSPLQQLTLALDTLAVGTANQLPAMGNQYFAYKLISKGMGIDSVKFTTYPVASVDSLESVMAKLTTANMDSLARLMQPDYVDNIQSLVGAEDDNKFAKLLETAPLNTLVTYTDSVNGQAVAAVINVKYRSNPVPVYELGVATYQLMPSGDTEKLLTQNLRNYVGKNGNAEAFVKNAAKAGYDAQATLINASTPLGDAAPNSMAALKWAMTADQGAVSKVSTFSYPSNANMGASSYLLAVCVDEIFEDDYIPVNSAFVKEQLKNQVLQDKKAQYVIDQYKGKAKTIEEAAKLFGVQVQTANGSFGSNNNAPELLSALATAKPGTLVGPVKGSGQVYFIQVNEAPKTEGRPYDFAENAGQFVSANLAGLISQNGMPTIGLLLGDNKVTNNILEFTAGLEKE